MMNREWMLEGIDDIVELYEACTAMHRQGQGMAMLAWPRDELEPWE